MRILPVLIALVLAGCDSREEIRCRNQQAFAAGGEVVGRLPSGAEVRRYRVARGLLDHDHWVYVIDGNRGVTVNRLEHHGKNSTVNRVEAMLEDDK